MMMMIMMMMIMIIIIIIIIIINSFIDIYSHQTVANVFTGILGASRFEFRWCFMALFSH